MLRHRPTDRIAGYYTLSATSIETTDLPEDIARRLPRYRVQPAILLGRLARDLGFRGMGVGELLMRDALERCLQIQQTELGAVAVVVDAIDEAAAHFYEGFGFIHINGAGQGETRRLFVPMETIARAQAT